jgi:hypothetical protein
MPFTATNADFNTMLKKYMPYNLLFEEVMKRDYFLGKVDKDQTWKGGEMQIPFMGAHASSISYGELTAEAEINEDKPVLGTVGDYKEIWGAMVFNDHDLARHDNMEQSFLKILPDRLEAFVERMKEAVSINLLNGTHSASLDVAAAGVSLVGGIVGVDRPARLSIGQYFEIGSVGTNKAAGLVDAGAYVGQIDIGAKLITLYSDKALTTVVDLSAAGINVVAGDKLFVRGATIAGRGFTALRDQFLSLANGGSANLFGVAKLAYPHLQATNVNGATFTAITFLENLFESYNTTRELGKGSPTDFVMSYKNLAAAMRNLELGASNGGADSSAAFGRGQFKVTDTRASAFGWTEIDIVGVKGKLTIVGVQEMDDDIIYMLDWRGVKLHSNGFFERRTAPDGKQFYETRSTTGYKYIIDTRFFGELVVTKPSHSGIIHSVNI